MSGARLRRLSPDPVRVIGALKVVVVAGMGAAGLSGLLLVVQPFRSPWVQMTLEVSMMAAGCGLVALGHMVALERRRMRLLMIAGLVLVVVGPPLLWLGPVGETIDTLAAIATTWAILIMIIGISLCQPAGRRVTRALQRCTIALAVLMMLSAPPVVVLTAADARPDRPLRIFVALGLLTAAFMVAHTIAARLRADAQQRRITVVCPRCEHRQALREDGDRCDGCGLAIKVSIP